MFYNMGAISASDANSIYEEKNALKYVSSLKHYPLRLDIALPIFSWGIGTRNGKVHYLLNKMYTKDFEKDSNFVRLSEDRFRAKHSFFKGGYYIMENDEIKIENVGAKDLKEMTNMLIKNISQPVNKIIFYDLDSSNIINYESNIFQTVSQGGGFHQTLARRASKDAGNCTTPRAIGSVRPSRAIMARPCRRPAGRSQPICHPVFTSIHRGPSL